MSCEGEGCPWRHCPLATVCAGAADALEAGNDDGRRRPCRRHLPQGNQTRPCRLRAVSLPTQGLQELGAVGNTPPRTGVPPWTGCIGAITAGRDIATDILTRQSLI
jgi:hypothetical protein